MAKVAIVKTGKDPSQSFQHALALIGGINDLNTEARNVTVKVGVYDERNLNYPTVEAVKAVTTAFSHALKIYLAESDNHEGKALKRLQIWKDLYTNKVTPFDLSHDTETNQITVCREKISFSHILFKPNILVSLHVLRAGGAGSIFKNLLGTVPDTRKQRFHKNIGDAMVDIAEALGNIDLAVIDGTWSYGGEWKQGIPLERRRRDLLIVGRDPVAVEVVGSLLIGEDPLSVPSVKVAKARGLGESNVRKIEILGEQIDDLK